MKFFINQEIHDDILIWSLRYQARQGNWIKFLHVDLKKVLGLLSKILKDEDIK